MPGRGWRRPRTDTELPRNAGRTINQWSPKLEAMGYGLIQRANYRAWVFGEMTMAAKWWGDQLAIISAVITGLVSVESLVGLANPKTEESGEAEGSGNISWLRVGSFLLSLLATVLLSLITVWQPSETSSASRATQVKYLQIKRSLTLQLALDREERHLGEEFMKTMLDDVTAAALSAPVPYSKVLRKAEARFGVQFEAHDDLSVAPQFQETRFSVRIPTQTDSPRRGTYTYPLLPSSSDEEELLGASPPQAAERGARVARTIDTSDIREMRRARRAPRRDETGWGAPALEWEDEMATLGTAHRLAPSDSSEELEAGMGSSTFPRRARSAARPRPGGGAIGSTFTRSRWGDDQDRTLVPSGDQDDWDRTLVPNATERYVTGPPVDFENLVESDDVDDDWDSDRADPTELTFEQITALLTSINEKECLGRPHSDTSRGSR